MRTIEIVINPKGESTVQTKGFAGASCCTASKFIEQALGQRSDERLTAEFHQVPSIEQQRQQQRS
jgi:hypothetical protein